VRPGVASLESQVDGRRADHLHDRVLLLGIQGAELLGKLGVRVGERRDRLVAILEARDRVRGGR
jgi:hypothetical protein